MPDYAGLKLEIAKPAYNGLSDDQIATALTSPHTVTIDVPCGSVEGYFRSRMLMGGIQKFIATPPTGASTQLVEGVSELIGMLTSPHVSVVQMTDLTVNTAVTNILGAMVSAGLISGQNQTDLICLASKTTTIAQTYGFQPDVHDLTQEILAARKWV